MELRQIKTQTTWEVATDSINHNNGKINEAVTRLENATYKNKGYFKSVEELQNAFPNPSNGSRAFVGNNPPYAIYTSENGTWIYSGEGDDNENIVLDNLYTKDDIVWLPQEDFDAMNESGALDPTKEYRTYEE